MVSPPRSHKRIVYLQVHHHFFFFNPCVASNWWKEWLKQQGNTLGTFWMSKPLQGLYKRDDHNLKSVAASYFAHHGNKWGGPSCFVIPKTQALPREVFKGGSLDPLRWLNNHACYYRSLSILRDDPAKHLKPINLLISAWVNLIVHRRIPGVAIASLADSFHCYLQSFGRHMGCDLCLHLSLFKLSVLFWQMGTASLLRVKHCN